MRLLVALVVVGGLIYFGWEKPFKQWAAELRAKEPMKQSASVAQESPPTRGGWMWNPDHRGALDRPADSAIATAPSGAAATPSRPGAWMRDPNHRSTLERPAYDQKGPLGAVSTPPPRYRDASGRTYWIDAQGVPHYDQ
jgi:hypothetical protein